MIDEHPIIIFVSEHLWDMSLSFLSLFVTVGLILGGSTLQAAMKRRREEH